MPRLPQETKLKKLIAKESDPKIRETLQTLLKYSYPSICLRPKEDGPEFKRSQIGGRPFLAVGKRWPQRADKSYLNFLVQIDLAEIPWEKFKGDSGGLPREGLLSFFYDAAAQPWSSTEGENDGHTIIYSSPDAVLRESPTPSGVKEAPRRGIEFVVDLVVDLDKILDEPDIYEAADVYGLLKGIREEHRLFGPPAAIQNDPREEPPTRTNDWKLLLQFASDLDFPAYMWGDAGKLYFMIPSDNFAEGELSESWVSLQCY